MTPKKAEKAAADAAMIEKISAYVAYVVPKKQKNGFKEWVAMGQNAMMMFARDGMGDLATKNLTVTEYRVFWALAAHVEFENFILTPQTEIAAKMGLAKSHFSKALKRLVECGVFEKGPKIGRMVSLKMSPSFGWKGTAQNHVVALLDEERAKRMTAAGITGIVSGGQERDTGTVDMFQDLPF